MKDLKQIKEEYKNYTGHVLPIYTFNGKLGVIYNHGIDFVPIEDLLKLDTIDFDAIRSVNSESDICEEGEEITDAPIRCDENEQKLIVDCVWSSIDYNKSDEFERELLVTTNQYYNWTSERRRMIDRIEALYKKKAEYPSTYAPRMAEYLKDMEKEWDEIVAQYEDPCDFALFYDAGIDFNSLLYEAYTDY